MYVDVHIDILNWNNVTVLLNNVFFRLFSLFIENWIDEIWRMIPISTWKKIYSLAFVCNYQMKIVTELELFIIK